MIVLTKIFHFEMAHAIHGYEGNCKNVHGHSYELHVSVTGSNSISGDNYIPSPGMIMDLKELKRLVNSSVLKHFDHHLLLSEEYLKVDKALAFQENLFAIEAEPTVENMLLYIRYQLQKELPIGINLTALKLFETNNSYAEWMDTSIIKY
jgi:6-pyruvoyltetrahydropterin/6-carboxytetrahydropterin synthase